MVRRAQHDTSIYVLRSGGVIPLVRIGVPATESSLNLELFRGYELAPGSYDEVFSSRGVLRPAWKTFLKAASGISRGRVRPPLGAGAAAAAAEQSRLSRSWATRSARRRPWELDGLPLIIPADEWRTVEAVAQATRHVARSGAPRSVRPADAGSRWHSAARGSLSSSWLSLAVLPRTRSAPIRACCEFYAADLARAPDGRWWVLADRTESASGAGFALENRIAMSRHAARCLAAMRRRTTRSVFHRRQGATCSARAASTTTNHASCCSARRPAASITSKMRFWPATSATRSPKRATWPFAAIVCI